MEQFQGVLIGQSGLNLAHVLTWDYVPSSRLSDVATYARLDITFRDGQSKTFFGDHADQLFAYLRRVSDQANTSEDPPDE